MRMPRRTTLLSAVVVGLLAGPASAGPPPPALLQGPGEYGWLTSVAPGETFLTGDLWLSPAERPSGGADPRDLDGITLTHIVPRWLDDGVEVLWSGVLEVRPGGGLGGSFDTWPLSEAERTEYGIVGVHEVGNGHTHTLDTAGGNGFPQLAFVHRIGEAEGQQVRQDITLGYERDGVAHTMVLQARALFCVQRTEAACDWTEAHDARVR